MAKRLRITSKDLRLPGNPWQNYDLTKGTAGSRIVYFSANPNGEAETVKVILKPKPRQKLLVFEKDFSSIAIKGRASMGNLLTKTEVHKITLKQKGSSTWGKAGLVRRDVLRLNYDGRGEALGEFLSDDLILVICRNGDFFTTNFDLSNHYEDNILIIEKFDSSKVWTAALWDADQKYNYLKRFQLESSSRKQNFWARIQKAGSCFLPMKPIRVSKSYLADTTASGKPWCWMPKNLLR